MRIQARLSAINGTAAKSADEPNKINLKFDPLFLSDDDAGWLFDHLGQYLTIELERAPPQRTPLEDAIDSASR